jgi:hypothetical protein
VAKFIFVAIGSDVLGQYGRMKQTLVAPGCNVGISAIFKQNADDICPVGYVVGAGHM